MPNAWEVDEATVAESENPSRPITLFYSYSHRDERFREKIENQLKILQRRGVISEWHDRKIGAGKDWAKEIDTHLETAGIILLLVSDHFLASEYCWGKEMTRALERYHANEARVIPVILQPCLWQDAPIARLQALPRDGRPVTKWPNRAEAYLDVANGIRTAAHELQALQQANGTTQLTTPVQTAAVITVDASSAASVAPLAVKPVAVPAVHIGVDPRKLSDLAVFKDVDAPWCPELVVIPEGSFLMGSPDSDPDAGADEKPQHRVTIGYRFALGRYPVTVAEYRQFFEETGGRFGGGMWVWTGCEWKMDRTKSWLDPGFEQTDCHPLVGVIWQEAAAYGKWLSKQTGQLYRLPSEAEWEYVCRAGAATQYAFGEDIAQEEANFEHNNESTTAVGLARANRWGLHEMHGNVWELVTDWWHSDYRGAPSDGSAWTSNASYGAVIRGGSWSSTRQELRCAHRVRVHPKDRSSALGFRVARDLVS